MSERLKEMKENIKFHIDWSKNTHYAEVNEEELKEYAWAIEQAKRVEYMKKLVNYHQQKQKEAEDANEPYRHQNKRYRAIINAMGQIFKDAIHSLDVGEKVQGLEYGVAVRDEALEDESE